MDNSSSVKNNFIFNFLAQMVIYIVPIISMPYVSRVLGAEHIGEYSYATSIVSYFTLFASLGSSMYGQRKIAYCRNDKEDLSREFWNIVAFRFLSTILFSLLYLFIIFRFLGFSAVKLIAVLHTIDVCFDITWFYQGLEDFKQTLCNRLLIKACSFAGIFIFVRNADDTWKYALIVLGSIALGDLILWRNVPKLVDKPVSINPFGNIKGMWLVFLPTIASQIYLILDKSMIGWITGSDYFNGCYEQSERLVRAAIVLTSAVSTVIFPRVANLHKTEEMDKIRYYLYSAYRVALMMALPAMMGFIATADYLIPIYLGDGYDLSVSLLVIFSFLLIPVTLASITGLSYLVATGQQNVYTLSVTVSAFCNFTMNIFLIRSYGAVGAAIASVAAETIGASIQIFYCVKKKELELKNIFVPSLKYFIASIIMFGGVVFLKTYLDCTIKNLILLVVTGVILYFSVLLLLKDELFIGYTRKAINRLFKSKE